MFAFVIFRSGTIVKGCPLRLRWFRCVCRFIVFLFSWKRPIVVFIRIGLGCWIGVGIRVIGFCF